MGLYRYEDNDFLRSVIKCLVHLLAVVSLAWFIVYSFFGQTIVSGNSMSPVLEADDICLVNRLAYDLGNPDRYDIVLFERNDNGKTNIKRVVGLPGEQLQIVSNSIFINGKKLSDDRLGSISLPGIAENTVVLAADEYFLIGDNADSSEDSRFQNIGNVKRKNIRGKLWMKISPFSRFGPIF